VSGLCKALKNYFKYFSQETFLWRLFLLRNWSKVFKGRLNENFLKDEIKAEDQANSEKDK